MPFRLILGTGEGLCAAEGPTNMALDAALLAGVQAGGRPVVRFYRWAPACLSFGRNQPAAELYDRERAAALGIGFVRRPTGGQAVLHDDELTYAVVAPISLVGRPRAAYARVNEALVAGLRALGVPARTWSAAAPSRAAVPPPGGPGARTPDHAPPPGGPGADWAAACFRRPATGEVVVGGRKLVGSAQRTEGRVILQHGSLLLGGSQAAAEALLVRASGGAPAGAAAEWTTLEAELGERPGDAVLVDALADGFASVFGTGLAPSPLSEREVAEGVRQRERFASEAWTWRR